MTVHADARFAALERTVATLQQTLGEREAERDAALAREAALAEVLDVINRSPGDPTPVFETILRKAHELIGAQLGCLFLYDGSHVRGVAVHGYPAHIGAVLLQANPPTRGMRAVIGGERYFHVRDLKASPIAIGGDANPIASTIRHVSEVRTNLIVPLRKDGAVLGFITANRTEVRAYAAAEIALLQNFAAQAVIAMENARLLTEQREALEQQAAMAEVLAVINASPGNTAPVFDTILQKAHQLCGADIGTLATFDGTLFHAVASHGFPDYHIDRMRRPFPPHESLQPLLDGARVLARHRR